METDRQVMQVVFQRLRRRLVSEAREDARRLARPFMVPRRSFDRDKATAK